MVKAIKIMLVPNNVQNTKMLLEGLTVWNTSVIDCISDRHAAFRIYSIHISNNSFVLIMGFWKSESGKE